MKKALRWFIGIALVFIVLVIALIFSIDPIAKSIAQKKIKATLGMETKIRDLNINLMRRSIHIEGFRLLNSAEFGGGDFMSLPELYVELDVDKVRETQKIHLKTVRINLGELHFIENKDGRRNVDGWQIENRDGKPALPTLGTNSTAQTDFGSIKRLEVSLGRVHFTNERDASQSFDKNLGITNRVFDNIQTEHQLKAVGVILIVQTGIRIF